MELLDPFGHAALVIPPEHVTHLAVGRLPIRFSNGRRTPTIDPMRTGPEMGYAFCRAVPLSKVDQPPSAAGLRLDVTEKSSTLPVIVACRPMPWPTRELTTYV